MQLVGIHDSPFVRRVAITAKFLGVPLEYKQISIFRAYDDVSAINPMVKVPTLVCDDGQILVDSTLIIDYLERTAGRSMMPDDKGQYARALYVIGTAMVVMEKCVQLIYEVNQRPAELQYAEWIARVEKQLRSAADLMEDAVGDGESWLFGSEVTQADITAAIGWRFVRYSSADRIDADDYPGLVRFSARAEALPEFIAVPIA